MSEVTITITDLPSSDAAKTIKMVQFTGQLDETNVDEKSKVVYDLIEAVPKGLNMVFDFTNLEYMNSKSVGYLTDWYTKVSAKGGNMIVAAARPNIVDILEVVGLTQIIQFVTSVDEAKMAITGGAAAASPTNSITPQPMQDATTPPAGGDQGGTPPAADPAATPAVPTPAAPMPETAPAPEAAPTPAEPTPAAPMPEPAPAPVEVTPAPAAPAPAVAAPATPAEGGVEVTQDGAAPPPVTPPTA